jgi:hypothetical protein
MKSIISKYFVLSTLLLLSLTSYTFAGPALPTSTQVSDSNDLPKSKQTTKAAEEEEIELVPEIKIDAQSASSNPKLKEGKACDYDDLEEVKGELFTEIPMAKTMPCDKVDCSDLKAARMLRDNYKKLPTAKTISCAKK